MGTALLSGREFNLGIDPITAPEARPTHRITNLIEVTNLKHGMASRPTPIGA